MKLGDGAFHIQLCIRGCEGLPLAGWADDCGTSTIAARTTVSNIDISTLPVAEPSPFAVSVPLSGYER